MSLLRFPWVWSWLLAFPADVHGNPECWGAGYTYQLCCTQKKGICWDGIYTYAKCCFAPGEAPSQPAALPEPQNALKASAVASHAASPVLSRFGGDLERRSDRYLSSATRWVQRARSALQSEVPDADDREGGGDSNAQGALVLNSLLWGAVTELLAAIDLTQSAESRMWGPAAHLMAEIARVGKDLSPSIFDPDALDAHTEALLTHACELVGCGQLPPRVHDLSWEDLKESALDDQPEGYVFSSADPTLRPVGREKRRLHVSRSPMVPDSNMSSASCATLGWSMPKLEGSPECYAGSDMHPYVCATSMHPPLPGCSGKKSWQDALSFCSEVGARLCTETEYASGLGRCSGCGYDEAFVWTGTSCGSRSHIAHKIGKIGRVSEAVCTPDDMAEAYSRCCADAEGNIASAPLAPKLDLSSIAVKQSLFPTDVWVMPLGQHLPQNFTSFLAETAISKFKEFKEDMESMTNRELSLEEVNNAFFAWQPSEDPTNSDVWPELYASSQFKEFRRLILDAGKAYLSSRGDRRAEALEVAIWASVYLDAGAGIDYHDHPLSILAGGFYASVPEGSPIAYADPRGVRFDYVEQSEAGGFEPKAPFHRQVYFEPVDGDLALFPPWLLHRVPAVRAGPRVTYACNFFTERGSPLTAWSGPP